MVPEGEGEYVTFAINIVDFIIESVHMNYNRKSRLMKRWLSRCWAFLCPRRRRNRLRMFPFVARGSWFTHRSEHASSASFHIPYPM